MAVIDNLVDRARRSKALKYIYLKLFSPYVDLHIKEISFTIKPRPAALAEKRLNLLVPSISAAHVFGGISTALNFFEQIARAGDFKRRIIVINAEPQAGEIEKSFPGYRIGDGGAGGDGDRQILPCRHKEIAVPVGPLDYFMATAWWTAYCAQNLVNWQAEHYCSSRKPLLYLIQDFEPGFYPWSGEYLLCESTYRYDGPQVALFNTKLLKDYFKQNGFHFTEEFYFEPPLNEEIRRLKKELAPVKRKKQILIYGRPSTPRNAFPLILEGLKVWAAEQLGARQWKIISVGEKHRQIDLGKGVSIQSLGKVSLEEYARLLAESAVGVSLMVSPHPSYPPLEMAEYGLQVITNSFQAKDLSQLYPNIVSLQRCLPADIAAAIAAATQKEPLPLAEAGTALREQSDCEQLSASVARALLS